MTSTPSIEERCRHAAAALDHLLREHPDNLEREINEATHTLVALRNHLIADARSGSQQHSHYLPHVNATISVLMAGHYPIEGRRWDCIGQARDALARLLT